MSGEGSSVPSPDPHCEECDGTGTTWACAVDGVDCDVEQDCARTCSCLRPANGGSTPC